MTTDPSNRFAEQTVRIRFQPAAFTHTKAFVLGLCLSGMATLSAAATPDTGQLDAAIEREHAAGRFDGVVLVGRSDAVAYQRAIGLADRAANLPHRVDAVWRWASVSKQLAAVLAMQQVEKGRLTLDSPLSTLLPAFKAPRATDISLRMLLQHTSGLPNPDTEPGYYSAQFKDDRGPVDTALRFCSGKPAGEPGARFAYSNCDTLVLQAVLERLTGEPYARLLQDAVAKPLGLAQLSLTPARADAISAAMPKGYEDANTAEPDFNIASFGAGGALRGTPQDLWQFDRALMQGRLLGQEALRALWQGEPKLGYVALGAWSFPARLAGCSKSVALIERRGQIGGVQVRNLIAPALGAALIVFSNTAQTDFGEIWQGKGLSHELASLAFCGAPAQVANIPAAGTASAPGDVPQKPRRQP